MTGREEASARPGRAHLGGRVVDVPDQVMQAVAAAAVRTVRVPPTVGVATWPSPHTGVEPASAVRVGSGVAAKTESGSTADLTASRRSVFGP